MKNKIYYFLANFGIKVLDFVLYLFWVIKVHNIKKKFVIITF